ncbi:MAG: sugar transferase [Bacteroidota bacterium]
MYRSFIKPCFDFLAAIILLVILFPLLVVLGLILILLHGGSPFFTQKRIGQKATTFIIYKFKTIAANQKPHYFLKFLRKTKLDELPQLINVLKGEMSFVGPRPDIPGYYDFLQGENRKILALKPGLTGYASLIYSQEEEVLKKQPNPKQYNDEIIFPHKVKLNLWYYQHISFLLDLKILLKTLFLPFTNTTKND